MIELLLASLILGYWSVGMVLLTSLPKRWTPKEYPIPSPPPATIADRVEPAPGLDGGLSFDPQTNSIYAAMIAGGSQLSMNQMVEDMQNTYNQMANPYAAAVVPDQFGPFLSKTQKRKLEKKEFADLAIKNYKAWLAKRSPNAMADLAGTNVNEDLDLERIR